MYQALYRSFRPETFDGILGQEHIVKILKNQIATGTVGHAYLFCGTHGTGKTSTARILAKAVNCIGESGERPCGVCPNCRAIKEGTFLDVIEIDAASNNGVENIRELRESVKYPPAAGACKVYIIDEVHMLSAGAFNALLKTLEEPPAHVLFILATTEPQKLPATILSRCLRLDFRRVPEAKLRAGMRSICGELGVKISDAALGLIASNADGSVRDALSLLDQCISAGGNEVTRKDLLDFLGTSGEEVFLEMTDFVADGNVAEAILLLNRLMEDGKDVRQFLKDWVAHYRNLLLAKYMRKPGTVLNLSEENVERLREQSERLDLEQLDEAITELSKTLAEAKWSTQPRVLAELCMVKLCKPERRGKRAVPDRKPAVEVPAAAVKKTECVKPEMPSAEILHSAAKKEEPAAACSELETGANDAGTEAEPGDGAEDLDLLWDEICDAGEAVKGSFHILRTGARLAELTDRQFVIEADGAMSKQYAEMTLPWLEELMEKRTGTARTGACRNMQAASAEDAVQRSGAELAQELGAFLGVDVTVEK